MSENSFEFGITHTVTAQQICNLMCTALDGRVGYWARIEINMPEDPDWSWCTEKEKAEWMSVHKGYVASMCGGYIDVIDTEVEWQVKDDIRKSKEEGEDPDPNPEKYRFTVEKDDLIKGMQIMARDYPHHFSDFIRQNDDATTGDVFLQCVVFGEVVRG